MANGWGGARRNSGPTKGSKYALPRPELKPRAEFMSKVTSAELLTPIEVMHDNMVFYHLRAGVRSSQRSCSCPRPHETSSPGSLTAIMAHTARGADIPFFSKLTAPSSTMR